jgi:hypothetical protein
MSPDPNSNLNHNTITVKYVSFSISRLISALILIGIGLLDFIYLGFSMGHPTNEFLGAYNEQGVWLFLGGVSTGIMVGLTPLVLGVFLLLYSILSLFIGTISKSSESKSLEVSEKRFFRKVTKSIPLSDISKISYQNNHIGPKSCWILIAIPTALTLLQWGIPLFDSHMSSEDILPIGILITGIVLLIIPSLLVLYPQDFLTIETKLNIYQLWVSPIKRNKRVALLQILGFDLETPASFPSLNNKFLLLFGGFLLGLSLISFIGIILMSSFFSLIGAAYGLILILSAFLRDTTNALKKVHYVKKTPELDDENKILPRTLNFIDLFVAIVFLAYGVISLFVSWRYVDISNGYVLLDQLGMTLCFTLVVILLFLYWILPENWAKPKNGDTSISLKNLKELISQMKQDNIIQKIIRIRVIGLCSMIFVGLILAIGFF